VQEVLQKDEIYSRSSFLSLSLSLLDIVNTCDQ